MNPLWLDNMSWEMAEVYGAITDQILINLAKYFPYYTAGNVPKSAFTYQAAMLAQMGQVNRETARIIRNGLKDADSALKGALEQAIIESVKKAEPSLWKGVQKGIFMPPQTPVVAPNQYRAFQLYYEQAADKLNLVNTVMLESTGQAYQQAVSSVVADIELADRMNRTQIALDVGAGETITGVSSWNQAVKHTIDKLKDGGITGFIDHGGHRWSAEAYAAMDIRTTMYNTSRAAVWETNQNFGNDLYLVSYHSGARPLCYDWQNKVISSTNAARDVTDLDGNVIHVYAQSETTYGEPAGLFGINCKHYPSPFIPGVSLIRGEPQSPEENAKAYAESQHQRGLERKIREEKRDLLMMKAQGAPDEMIKAQRAKIRKTDDDIDAFCAETGRARRQNREGVYTTRDFPDAKTYDVTQFTNEQKERIERYYREGGEQQGFKFGQMTPNVPLVPNTPVVPPATTVQTQIQSTTQQQQSVMTYGEPFNGGRTVSQKKQFADAKDLLEKAPDTAKQAWSKAAPDMKAPVFKGDAYYKPGLNEVHFKSYAQAFEESSYQRKNTVFFHEYAHNMDNKLGGGRGLNSEYLSVSYNGGSFGKMIAQECEEALKQFHAQSGMTEAITDKAVGRAFAKWVKDTYTIYERSDISDMFERYMVNNYGIQFPFGVGHGSSYQRDANNTPIESFAEMFSATVTGSDSLGTIKQFFPKSYQIFLDMLGSVV